MASEDPSHPVADFDYIFAGGGCASLSLVWQILHQPKLRDKSILILEPESKNENDRTWCFWEAGEGPFEDILEIAWDKTWFYAEGFSRQLIMNPYRYKMIRSGRFYKKIHDFLRTFPKVQMEKARVTEFLESPDSVEVMTETGSFRGRYLFNSIITQKQKEQGHFYLLQHFKGWYIRVPSPVFDVTTATLMDFRIPQEGECRFMYTLPLSATEALVEFTVFSESHLTPAEYGQNLTSYLQDFLGLTSWEILEEEFGSIPMFSAPFEDHRGGRVVPIGTAGGQTKASSGYTFTRIQKHSVRLAEALARTGKPDLHKPPGRGRFAFYDRVLLHVLAKKRVPAARIFRNLFRYNRPASVFRFLDEDTHLLQEYRLLNTVPVLKFLVPGFRELFRV